VAASLSGSTLDERLLRELIFLREAGQRVIFAEGEVKVCQAHEVHGALGIELPEFLV